MFKLEFNIDYDMLLWYWFRLIWLVLSCGVEYLLCLGGILLVF